MKSLYDYSYNNYVKCVKSYEKEPMEYWEYIKKAVKKE